MKLKKVNEEYGYIVFFISMTTKEVVFSSSFEYEEQALEYAAKLGNKADGAYLVMEARALVGKLAQP